MLPMKKYKGRAAFRNLSAFIEVPEQFTDKELISVPDAQKEPSHDYMTVGELSRNIGWQHNLEN
jgi:hypothetical protein